MAENPGPPIISTSIPQDFIIEALGGPEHPTASLGRFPDSLYNKSPESHLVRFMYALLGPSGVGQVAKNYLDARLQLEDLGVELFDLDAFFGDPFAFGRLLEETYDDDPDALLDNDAQERIASRDAQYRSRALDYLGGVRLGNSPQGMRLVAKAGLGHDVEIVENYKYLFDYHSDDPQGLVNYGRTNALNEMVVLPRQEVSRSAVQTITIFGTPSGGYWTPTFNGRPSDAAGFTNIPYNAPATTDWVDTPGTNTTLPDGRTVFDKSPNIIGVQEVLESHPDIGSGNIRVTGGPGPGTPWVVTFIGNLSGRAVPKIGVLGDPSTTLTGGAVNTAVTISTTQGGLDASDEIVSVGPREQYHLEQALDRIRAVSVIPTTADATGLRSFQPVNSVYATSEFTEVLRYVTGNPNVTWPAVDSVNWIEKYIEKEAPRAWGATRQHYQGFHDVPAVIAYTDAALADVGYEQGTIAPENLSEHTGAFGPAQAALFPPLASAPTDVRFTADRSTADHPEQPVVTGLDRTGEVALIRGIYPASYATLPGVPTVKYSDEQFWSSFERTDGTEYLEIDLGAVQAVNFLAFETLRKPVDIEVAYDYLDQRPRRRFTAVTPLPRIDYPDHVSFSREAGWTYLEFNFGDVNLDPIYSRYLRVALTRRSDIATPFLLDVAKQGPLRWSIEVRNLRVGRNVSN